MFLLPKSSYTVRTLKKTGRGVFATRDIKAGTVIGDYIGTIIKSDSNDENKNGLYDMRGGLKYDILANPKKDGIHLINHSCANNCDAYPYRGHVLYVALRKIYKGEEITVNYGLGGADEDDIVCKKHACHCGSRICSGTMHEDEAQYNPWYEAWEKLIKQQFGRWYRSVPGKYGSELPALSSYPSYIKTDDPKIYPSILGSEKKSPLICRDTALPSLIELRKRIRKSGRRLSFPRLHFVLYGIKNNLLLAEK